MDDAYQLDSRDEDLALLLHAWADMEAALQNEERDPRASAMVEALRHAFRVELQEVRDPIFGGDEFVYAVYFDVANSAARDAAAVVNENTATLDILLRRRAPVQGHRGDTRVVVVPRTKPVAGEVCARVIVPAPVTPDLRDLPQRISDSPMVDYVERDGFFLTPIEAPFYDKLKRTELTFSTQPWVQHGETKFRPDFIVFYGGQAVVVELDGHEGHKTKEQRSYDSKRERWFKARRMSTIRWTGSQVFADAKGCVAELLSVVRGGAARP